MPKGAKWYVSVMLFTLVMMQTAPCNTLRAWADETDASKPVCITADCHAKMQGAKFVHGPVAVGDCLLCHGRTGKHSFKLVARGAALCGQCHEDAASSRNNDCLACHDPHGSDREFQLKPGVGGRCKK